MIAFLLHLVAWLNLAWSFLDTHTGMPMSMAGTEIPARRAMPTGAPTKVPSCHISFFLRDLQSEGR